MSHAKSNANILWITKNAACLSFSCDSTANETGNWFFGKRETSGEEEEEKSPVGLICHLGFPHKQKKKVLCASSAERRDLFFPPPLFFPRFLCLAHAIGEFTATSCILQSQQQQWLMTFSTPWQNGSRDIRTLCVCARNESEKKLLFISLER